MTDTRERFEAICRQQSGHDGEITDDTRLYEDLRLDSLDRLDLAMRCEERFRIHISDDEVDQPASGTFGGMIALIEGKLAGA